MPVGDILPEITLILTAAAILLVAAFVRQDWHWLAAPLALIGLAVAGVLLVAQLGRSELTFSGVWALDDASAWARLLILGSTAFAVVLTPDWLRRSEEHTSELQSLMRISYAVFCLKKQKTTKKTLKFNS